MFEKLEILKAPSANAAEPSRRAIEFACNLAATNGATVYQQTDVQPFLDVFYQTTRTAYVEADPLEWARNEEGKCRIVLTTRDNLASPKEQPRDCSEIIIESAPWESEETLFARSGIAHLLGDPERRPLIPDAHYAAHSIGYAVFGAISAINLAAERFGKRESAVVNALAVMGWINWKAGAAGDLGRDLCREGALGAWPVLPCKDGYVAFLFTDRDWPAVVKMIGDPRLELTDFDTRKAREKNYAAFLGIVEEWLKPLSRSEANAQLFEYGIPGAAVAGLEKLTDDPLLRHRNTFSSIRTRDGVDTVAPVQACRVAREYRSTTKQAPKKTSEASLPLSGFRVVDFGIITAGAGVSAVLADLGAEVIKVESTSYPDPFRFWLGSDDSPLFKFNNRNKLGVDIDLKTPQGIKTILELIESADIVLENFRRGVLDRRGLTFDAMRERNPNVLLASISGQGLDGPGSGHATFGSTLEANSGFAALCAYEDGRPHVTGVNLNYPDQIVCLYAAAMIANHVKTCRAENIARHIDISQRDCAIYQLGDVIAAHGVKPVVEGAPSPVRTFKAKDGRYIAFSQATLDALSSVAGVDGTNAGDVAAWAEKQQSDDIVMAVTGAGFGAAKCLTGSEMMREPAVEDNEVFLRSPNGALVKGFPFQLQQSPMTIQYDAPSVGQHTDLILNR